MLSTSAENVDRAAILRNLPVFPAVALELIGLLDGGEASASEVAQLLRKDPALSAEVLHQANSAKFARRREVGELDEAVTLLGGDQTCRIAMRAACRGMATPALGSLELRGCWEHCVATAIVAADLAPHLGQNEGTAYVAGLLHDIGCLGLAAVYPEPYTEVLRLTREGQRRWLEAEVEVFGVDHCTVGSWVVDDWGLPEDLRQVIAHHHDEREPDRSLLTLVGAASSLADLLLPSPMEPPCWPDPAAFLATLPVDQAAALEAVEQANEKIKTELG